VAFLATNTKTDKTTGGANSRNILAQAATPWPCAALICGAKAA